LGRRGGLGRATWPGTLGLVSGPLLWLVVFFLLPIVILVAYSAGAVSLLPTDLPGGLDLWRRFLTGQSIYLGLFWKSVRMALSASVVVVVLAYPVAYFLALCVRKRKYVLLLVVIAPFLTSYLLRVLAWKLILGDRGVINSLLYFTHLRGPTTPSRGCSTASSR